MIRTTRDPATGCAGKNCPGLHEDSDAGTVTIEGRLAGTPAGMTPGPGEGFVTLTRDELVRMVREHGLA